jgi:hypothetical protein
VGAGIPDLAYVHSLKQDPKNPALLYAGTERGLYASWDSGASFHRLQLKNLPSTPVHDVFFQERENDLILATHGRGMFVLDDATPVQSYDPKAAPATRLLTPRPGLRFPVRFTRYGLGDKVFRSKNPEFGALLTYELASDLTPPETPAGSTPATPRIRLDIVDSSGRVIREVKKPGTEKGVNRVAWDLRHEGPKPRRDGGGAASEFGPPEGGPFALPGRYTARLTVDGQTYETPVEVRVDPLVATTAGGLQAQFDLASSLVPMVTEANTVLRGLDGLHAQTDERTKTMKALSRTLSPATQLVWDAYLKEHTRVFDFFAIKENTPFWSEAPRLAARLADLMAAVDDAYAAPSPAQREYFAKLQMTLRDAASAYRAMLDGPFARLNEALAKEGLPPLLRP